MKQENQEILFERYPILFKERHLDKSQTRMCDGIVVPDSWFEILDSVCYVIQFAIDNWEYPQILFTQVKEKFDVIRIYYRFDGDPTNNENYEKSVSFYEGVFELAEELTSKSDDSQKEEK